MQRSCGSWNNEETGEGLNSSGIPVNWLIWFEFDLTEEERKNCSPMIFCSWDHVRNGEGYWEAAENFDSAKKGSTYCEFAITSAEESFNGHERYAFMLFLPDNPSIAGEQSVTLQLGYAKKTIYFTLIYDGDYETGTGWKIVDVRY